MQLLSLLGCFLLVATVSSLKTKEKPPYRNNMTRQNSIIDEITPEEKARRESYPLDDTLMVGTNEQALQLSLEDRITEATWEHKFKQWKSTTCTFQEWKHYHWSKTREQLLEKCGKPEIRRYPTTDVSEKDHHSSYYFFAFAATFTCPNSSWRYDLDWKAEMRDWCHRNEIPPEDSHQHSNKRREPISCNYVLHVTDFKLQFNYTDREHPGAANITDMFMSGTTPIKGHPWPDIADQFANPAFVLWDADIPWRHLHNEMHAVMELWNLTRVTSRCDDIQNNEYAYSLCYSREDHEKTFLYNHSAPIFQRDARKNLDLEPLIRSLLSEDGTVNPCPDVEVFPDRFERQIHEHMFDLDIPSIQTLQKALTVSWKEKFINTSGMVRRAYSRSDMHMKKLERTQPYLHLKHLHVEEIDERRIADCEKHDNKEYHKFTEEGFFHKIFHFWRYWTTYLNCGDKIYQEDKATFSKNEHRNELQDYDADA